MFQASQQYFLYFYFAAEYIQGADGLLSPAQLAKEKAKNKKENVQGASAKTKKSPPKQQTKSPDKKKEQKKSSPKAQQTKSPDKKQTKSPGTTTKSKAKSKKQKFKLLSTVNHYDVM